VHNNKKNNDDRFLFSKEIRNLHDLQQPTSFSSVHIVCNCVGIIYIYFIFNRRPRREHLLHFRHTTINFMLIIRNT